MSNSRPIIIWTGSRFEGVKTHPDLVARKLSCLHWPMTSTEPLATASVTPHWPSFTPDLLLVTSRVAVKCCEAFPALHQFKQNGLPVYTFGKQTYRDLKQTGWKATCLDQANSSEQMAEFLVKHLSPSKSWYLAARRPAFDMAAYLEEHSWQVSHLALYQSKPISSATLSEKIPQVEPNNQLVVCLASPLAASIFATTAWPLLSRQGFDEKQILLVSIGPTTSLACHRHFGKKHALITADAPGFDQLITKAVSLIK